MGRPDDEAVWTALDDVLDHTYRFEDGLGLHISMTFVDEGGHFTQEVRMQCRNRIGKKVFCIKGMPGQDRPFTGPPKQMKITVDSGKQIIMDNIRVKTPGAKYCHFPRRDDYGPGYFAGLLSEHLVYEAKNKHPWQWKKIPGHERNEVLDCRNYALAAFKALPVDLDQIAMRLRGMRSKQVLGAVATAPKTQVRSSAQVARQGAALRKYYDEW